MNFRKKYLEEYSLQSKLHTESVTHYVRTDSAITLIALVITIIVLLILAGVSLNLILGNQGILNQATSAVDEYKKANIAEEIELAKAQLSMAYYSNEDVAQGERLNEYILRKLNGYILGSGATISKTQDGSFSFTDKSGNTTEVTIDSSLNVGVGDTQQNQTPVIPEEPNITTVQSAIEKAVALSTTSNTTLTDAYGNKVVVPAGFKVTTDATTVDKGIVIEDVTNTATLGSQFVWIPVPTDGYVKGENGQAINDVQIILDRYTFAENGTPTRQGENVINPYYQELQESTYENITAKSISDFQTSVANNNGYYIARYEARTATKRATENDVLTQITAKGGEYVYNFVTQIQAADLSRNMYISTVFTSDLMNSYAWDTATLFLQECGENSTYSRKTSVNTTLATIGTNNQDTKDVECNVYDMASNTAEWTTESSSLSDYPCMYRGGFYSNMSFYTSSRYCTLTSDSYPALAFRPILYL